MILSGSEVALDLFSDEGSLSVFSWFSTFALILDDRDEDGYGLSWP
jgi:hypothetical protein